MSQEQGQQQSRNKNGGRGRGGRRGGGGRGRGGRGRGKNHRATSPNRNNGNITSTSNSNSNNNNYNNNNNNNYNNNYNKNHKKKNNSKNNASRIGNGGDNYPQQMRQPKQPPVPNTKKNGEKGADAHTVSEKTRIMFTKILTDFREDDTRDRFEFPSDLTNTERKFLHQLAGQLGLTSKSTGKGEARRIAVTKRSERVQKTKNGGEDLSVLRIGAEGRAALKKHVARFPPTRTEAIESRETGASLAEAVAARGSATANGNANDNANGNADAGLLDVLNKLGLGGGDDEVDRAGKGVPFRRARRVDPARRTERHASYQARKQAAREYQQVLRNRSKLPAYGREAEIVATVHANPVTVIQGETGCGKSTQCPQFLLDANPTASIAVTQPRRISAISIAERVAQEQCLGSPTDNNTAGGGGVGSLVGYQVRLETASSKDTQLLFLTPGVLLRKLQSSPMLSEYTHIIIDEVHERDKYTEFLLIRLRDLLPIRPDLRLVLMSATLQTEVLMQYFSPDNDSLSGRNKDFYRDHPPVMLSIEGRTFPVQEFFLEHVLELTEYIDVDAFDDGDDVENADEGGGVAPEKRPMSMNELDAALARVMSSNGGTQSFSSGGMGGLELTARCALCGKGFPGPIELGEHMAVCTGLMEEDVLFDQKEDAVKTAAFSNPQFLEGDGDKPNGGFDFADADFEDYDEYDIDECQEVADYVFQEVPELPAPDPIEEEKKWDGEGLFQADVEQDVVLTPKQEKYLKHYQTMYDDEQINTELLLEVLHYIVKKSKGEGAILVFLPGWHEISEVSMLLENTVPFHNRSKFLILPLHSGIPSQDQRRVLRRPPPGSRKIVLSTNIAETSLTIDDVAFVIDSGRAKEKDYDPHLKTSTLQPIWISQSSAKQRKGRAGRTKAGVCFHLFSSTRHQSMRPFVESELLRTPLEEMCLMTKKLGLAPGGPEDDDGVPAFLSKAITPPHAKSISNALELLENLGAMLPETNDLTSLGECLSVLSLEPRVGKMVIWSYLLGCTKVASQMAVAMAYKSPFVLPPPHMRREAERSKLILSDHSESDQVTVLNAVVKRDQLKKKKGESAYRDWCQRNYLSASSLQMIGDLRKNLTRELSTLGFADPMARGYHNRRDTKQHALWQAAIAAGLYPNVATRKRGDVNFSTMTNRKAKIHVSSVNALKGQPLNSKCQIPNGEIEFVCFGEMVKGSHFFTLSQTTHLPSALPLLLLCGTSLQIHPIDESEYSELNLDDWIVFQCSTEEASRLVILRRRLEGAFWNAIAQPSQDPRQSMTFLEQDAIETLGLVLTSALKSSGVRQTLVDN
mmetsp:Transcript_29257/g.79144  ORF Transcript_29257/g.79144 Transcript_29257/m.79144 type:complete len:1313 (+) Transcript_29257:175-4113(+)